MRKVLIIITSIISAEFVSAQNFYKPSTEEIKTLPDWAKEMYSENPNVFRTDSLYSIYYSTHSFSKNYNTQYYKRWRRNVEHSVNENGYVNKINPAKNNPVKANPANRTGNAPWQLIGPFVMYDGSGQKTAEQTNIYSIDQNENNPNVLYCGTEPGDIFKSTDAGSTWNCMSFSLTTGSIGAIKSDPTDEDIVYAGTSGYILKSMDGGNSWNVVLTSSGFYANEIMINPGNPLLIYACSDNGLWTSADAGSNWTQVYAERCYDIKAKPGDPSRIYLLKNNFTLDICEFLLSTDSGNSFNVQNNGWYFSSDPARVDYGGRIAVSAADPSRVYAYLIGDSKPNDFGYIGIYKSDDSGITWNLPNGPVGGPYTTSHLNLAYGNPGWTYHQGFYNCAIMASQTNADEILIGGLNLYRSTDGGATFTAVAGYVGGPLNMHVDMQDFRSGNGGYWITNDGGVYFSNDFFTSDNNVKMDGIHGTDLWGFDSGWNEDVFIGGAYHNGNVSYYENYNSGDFLQLGGAEPASGYVNRGENRKVCSSDIGGKIMPASIGQTVESFSVSLFPNESYWTAESSEMEADPRCYNIIYLGNENKLWRSQSNTPYSFNLLKAFGTNVNAKVQHIEISRSNEDVIYVSQRPSSGSTGYLWKSTDGGTNWSGITVATGNSRRIVMALSSENENELWIAYPSGANGQKVYKTTNGGTSWNNLTSSLLDNEEVISIVHVGATDGGIYVFTYNTVFYRNDTMSNWTEVNNNLPATLHSNIAKPFYRDGKIRIGTYGKGIWENEFYGTPAYPIAQIMSDKLNATQFCSVDTFYFEDHSMLNHQNASWQWTLPGGNPASSSIRNPKVVYATAGTYDVYLTVTDSSGQSDSDTIEITVNEFIPGNFIQEGFQNAFPPQNWFMQNETNGGQWAQSIAAGSYGNSTQSTIFDNYNYDSQGANAWLYSAVDLSTVSTPVIKFDVAYSLYGFPYSDTLSVRVSNDCGANWTTLYLKGGSELATAPNNSNNMFVPLNSEWRTDSVDLSAYTGNSNVLIAFVNHGRWGQAVYLDNININSNVGVTENKLNGNITIFPNPVGNGENIIISGDETDVFSVALMDASGKIVLRTTAKSGQPFSIGQTAEGVYTIRVESENKLQYSRIIILSGKSR